MTMVRTGDEQDEYYKGLVDKGIVKKMQEVLDTDDELDELVGINVELNSMLRKKENEYKRIEYMARMVGRRISSIRDELVSKRMIKRGYHIVGEFDTDK